MSRLNSMVAGSVAGVAGGAAGVPDGTDCAAGITVAHSTSPTAAVHRATREILVLPENLLIESNPLSVRASRASDPTFRLVARIG